MGIMKNRNRKTDICNSHLAWNGQDKKKIGARFVTMNKSWIHRYDIETKIQNNVNTSQLSSLKKFKNKLLCYQCFGTVSSYFLRIFYTQETRCINCVNLISKMHETVIEERRGELRKVVHSNSLKVFQKLRGHLHRKIFSSI